MKLYAACMSCLLSGQEKRIRDYQNEDEKAEYMKELMRLIVNSTEETCAPWLAAQIEKVYEKYFGKNGDYKAIKEEYNRLVMSMEEKLEKKLQQETDPLRAALIYARVGNYIDFSAVEKVDQDAFLALFDRKEDVLDEKEYQYFCKELEQSKTLVYLLDNCGEIVLDKLVIRILKDRYPQLKITAFVRGAEVVNDVTMDDAIFTGLTEEVEVLSNGDDVAGTILSRLSEETREKMEKADVILSKGQGNFESLYGCGLNVYYLFLCKCDWFMKKFQVERFHGMFLNEKRV